MKKIFLVAILLFPILGKSQALKPAKWSYSTLQTASNAGDIIDLIFSAKIDTDWYLYSSVLKVEGPLATKLQIDNNGSVALIGGLRPINPKEKFDKIWNGTINYFTGEAQFVQKVKVLKPGSVVEGKVVFQTCTEKDGRCVPGKENFKINI